MKYFLDFLQNPANDNLPAVCVDDKHYTYSELKRSVSFISTAIQNRGLHQQPICVYQEDKLETYAAILAIWSTGNIFVPLNPAYPEARVAYILELTKSKLILSTKSSGFAHNGTAELFYSETTDNDCGEIKNIPYSSSDICYILFTSGSTGLPKGVQISYDNLSAFLEEVERQQYDLPKGSGFLQLFDLSFDFSLVPFLMPFINEGTLYHVSAKGVKYLEIYRILEEHPIHFVLIVPSLLNLLKPYLDDIHLPNLKVVALGGEAVPSELTRQWQACCPNARFYNFYGPTECTIFCTTYEIPKENTKEQNGIVAIGTENMHCEIKILDDQEQPVSSGEKGLMWVGGRQVTPGYLANEALNKEMFREFEGVRYYNTGDVVSKDEQGCYFYFGRKDQQVKINGYRIELSEVEHAAAELLQTETAVIAIKDAKDFYQMIVFLPQNIGMANEEINKKISEFLPSYMLPSKIILVPEFPVNSNGKLDRKALRAVWESKQAEHIS